MSQAWNQGYTSDIEYTSGYYREQEPAFLNLCAIMHGIEPVSIDKSFTYCELGCGMGHTSLIMAANYPQGKFIAVDFNPSHISHAKKKAKEAGLNNIEFLELSLEELANDSSLLPKSDFITFHGIYAWVNDNNRQYLSDICKQHLNSGGLVYNSYNAQPGWAALAPLQKTLNLLSQQYKGNSTERFSSAVSFVNKFKTLKPRYFEFNSTMLKPRLDHIEKADPAYLVHEYLNEGWEALYFSDVASKMTEAKLNYVGLANPAEAYSHTIIPDEFKKQLAEVEDFSAREMLKDLAYNTSFRKDLYSRGGRRIDAKQQEKLLKEMSWTLASTDDQSEFKFNLSVGEATGKKETYTKVIKTLAKKALTTEELRKKTSLPIASLIQTIIFLYSSNKIALENKPNEPKSLESLSETLLHRKYTANLNKVLVAENIGKQQPLSIAASKIGTSLLLNPIELIFFNNYLKENDNEDSLSTAENIYKEFLSNKLTLTIAGTTYGGEKMKKLIIDMEKSWSEETLPRLKSFGCV